MTAMTPAERQRLRRERKRYGLTRQVIDIPEEWWGESMAERLVELGFCDWDDIESLGLPRMIGEFIGEKLDGF